MSYFSPNPAAQIAALQSQINDQSLEISDLKDESEQQNQEIAEIQKGSSGPKLTGFDENGIFSVVVPSGNQRLIPFSGNLSFESEPPGIWTLTNGVIVGTNDLDDVRLAWALTTSFRDTQGSSAIWTFTWVRGRDLATTPVFSERNAIAQARTNVFNSGEPVGLSLIAGYTNPGSGDNFEYGLFAGHNQPGNRTIVFTAMSLLAISYGPGFS